MKILIVKTSALGDLVHVYPAIKEIRKLLPDAEIDWVVESACEPLAKHHPDIKQVITLHTKKWRRSPILFRKEIAASFRALREKEYDLLFDFQGNIKSWLITTFAKAKTKIGFGLSAPEWPARFAVDVKVDPNPGMNIREDYLALVEAWSKQKAQLVMGTQLTASTNETKRVQELLAKRSETAKNVLICPFSRWPNKQLTKETLIGFLTAIAHEIPTKFWVLYGHHSEKAAASEIVGSFPDAELVDPLSFSALQLLMQGMHHLIAVDSFPLHLAGESNVPTFAIFGPSSSTKYNPPAPQHYAFQGGCPYGKTFEKRCPILRTCSTGNCLHVLAPNTLVQAYQQFLKGRE